MYTICVSHFEQSTLVLASSVGVSTIDTSATRFLYQVKEQPLTVAIALASSVQYGDSYLLNNSSVD